MFHSREILLLFILNMYYSSGAISCVLTSIDENTYFLRNAGKNNATNFFSLEGEAVYC